MTPLIWPYYDEETIKRVSEVLRSGKVNYWTGAYGKEFETKFARYHGCDFGIAVSNGTVSLDLALYALDIGPGDEVIVSPRSFIASVSAVVLRGATPIFADVDLESQNITPETILSKISSKTKAILPVHLAGWPCEMDRIMEIAKEHGLFVIEDCAQAHGAKYKGKPVGSFGDIASFSFCQDKIMSTGGEGGMVTTNNPDLYDKMWSYKDHGKNRSKIDHHAPVTNSNAFRWLHDSFGTNYRMTEMQAVIGLRQLEFLDEWISKRQKNAEAYDALLKEVKGVKVVTPPEFISHSYYKYYAFIDESIHPNPLEEKEKILNKARELKIPCYYGSCSEIYLEKAFEGMAFKPKERAPNAKNLGDTALMFRCDPMLSDQAIEKTVSIFEGR